MGTLYRVWVDETGDRGISPKASPFFGFAAVVTRAEYMPQMQAAKVAINRDLERDDGVELHWSKNLRSHEKRMTAAEALGGLNARVIYSVLEKATMPKDAHLTNRDAMYNYALRFLLERISWLVDDHSGVAAVMLASVEGLPGSVPRGYVEKLRRMGSGTQIRWHALRPKVEIEQASRRDGLQMADIAAGALDRAMRLTSVAPHRIEPAYLNAMSDRIWTRGPGKMGSYGLKALPSDLWGRFEWWPAVNGLPWNG